MEGNSHLEGNPSKFIPGKRHIAVLVDESMVNQVRRMNIIRQLDKIRLLNLKRPGWN